jgi:hypothetical protein
LTEDEVFYTKTMAKVYENQGKYEKAVKIYRHLLDREPHRRDLADALCELEKKCLSTNRKELTHLFIQWIDLLLASNGLDRLAKLQRHLDARR